MATIEDKKLDIIEEAICAGPDGARCGCWDRECPRGCGFALEALDLWEDVKKTLKWLDRKTDNNDFSVIIQDLLARLKRNEPDGL
jgi:hypothetical protein